MRGDGKRQPHIHATGIGLDRLVDEFTDFSKRHDGVVAARQFFTADAIQQTAEKNILAPGELCIKARAQLQQCGNPPCNPHTARSGRQGAANQLQQGRFARTVLAHDGHSFSTPNAETHVPQRPELLEIVMCGQAERPPQRRHHHLAQTVAGLCIDLVALSQALHFDHGIRGHRRTLRACAGSPSAPTRRPDTPPRNKSPSPPSQPVAPIGPHCAPAPPRR